MKVFPGVNIISFAVQFRSCWGEVIMIEDELLKFQQEIGDIKQNLLTRDLAPEIRDEDSYRLATKIDLTVSRLIRLMEYK